MMKIFILHSHNVMRNNSVHLLYYLIDTLFVNSHLIEKLSVLLTCILVRLARTKLGLSLSTEQLTWAV